MSQVHAARYALTLGDQSEIHVGGKIYGNGLAEEGFSVDELRILQRKLGDEVSHLTDLTEGLPEQYRTDPRNQAAVLVIKGGINLLMGSDTYADRMLAEQQNTSYDKCYWDRRRQKKLNKIARYNAVFGDKRIEPSPDYQQSTVISYDEVPLFKALRAALPQWLGEKARGMESEGNFYYDALRSGIGAHGDSERKRVVCFSLGGTTTLRFVWRLPGSSAAGSKPFDFVINSSDAYIMSEKSTGYDWRCRSLCRLVHCAGAPKYIDACLAADVKPPKVKATVDKKRKSHDA